jgi:hypothetical protein
MQRTPLVAACLLATALAGCDSGPITAPDELSPHGISADRTTAPRVVQRVSVGSNDICDALGLGPGCDANFSLVANKWADGSVRGQWQDGYGKDGDGNQLGGIHVSIDCLEAVPYAIGIYVFKVAWVSGVVTKSTSPFFTVGEGVITAAVDRGTSANDLFEDLGTFSYPLSLFPPGTTCADRPELQVFLNTAYTGQVKIWLGD